MKPKIRRLLWILVPLLLVLIGVAIWVGFRFLHKSQLEAPPPTPVRLVTVSLHNIPVTTTALAHVVASEDITLKALQAGQVTGVYFKPGQGVQKGQALFSINDVTEQAAVAEAKANFLQARANEKRYRALLAQHAASQSDFDQYQAAYLQSKATLSASEQALQETHITAPFSGVVSVPQTLLGQLDASGDPVNNSTQVSVGSYVEVGDPLVELVSTGQHSVQYYLPDTLWTQVMTGQTVYFTPQSGGKSLKGVVSYIAPSVNTDTGTFLVEAQLLPSSEPLAPGTLGEVTQVLQAEHPVLAVPGLSLAADMSGYYVYQVENHILKKTAVLVGTRENDWVAIQKGLKPGDAIVADNLDALQQGMSVDVLGS